MARKTRRKNTGDEPQKTLFLRLPEWLAEAVHEYAGEAGTSASDYAEKIFTMLFAEDGLEIRSKIDEEVVSLVIEGAKAAAEQLTARRVAVDEAIKEAKAIDPVKRSTGGKR